MHKILYLAFVACVILSACAQHHNSGETLNVPSAVEDSSSFVVEPGDNIFEAYEDILMSFIHTEGHPLPGLDLQEGWEYPDDILENQLSILDIDKDGRKELLLRIKTGSHSTWTDALLRYNEDDHVVEPEHFFLSDSKYYNNGIVEEPVRNNNAPGSYIWPYTLWEYNLENDGYEEIGFVDSNYKDYLSLDNKFPGEIDEDGNGIVYSIKSKAKEGISTYLHQLDDVAYALWRENYIMSTSEIKIEWNSLAELAEKNLQMEGGAGSET